jgi:TorA maturation chaperone TorD
VPLHKDPSEEFELMQHAGRTDDELIEACGLLGSMYLCKPDRETLGIWRALFSEDVPDILSDLKYAVDKIDMASDSELEDLLWEYTRLFIGPYKLPCPPWESVYTSPKKLMMQEAYDEVRDYYNKAGLTVHKQGIMADHIGAELYFLAVLLEKAKSDPEKELYYQNLTKGFLAEHIMKWVPQFARDMEDAADSLFYKTLAKTTLKLLSHRGLTRLQGLQFLKPKDNELAPD